MYTYIHIFGWQVWVAREANGASTKKNDEKHERPTINITKMVFFIILLALTLGFVVYLFRVLRLFVLFLKIECLQVIYYHDSRSLELVLLLNIVHVLDST